MSKTTQVLSALVLVLIGGAAGFAFYHYAPDLGGEPPTAVAPATGPSLRLPDFSLPGLDEQPRSVSEWRGQSLLINFWATWCAPCRREIPLLNKLQNRYADRGVQVIGIAVDFMPEVQDYANNTPFDYPILVGQEEAMDLAASMGIEFIGLPFSVFTNSQGDIVKVHVGELKPGDAETTWAQSGVFGGGL